MTLKEQLHNSAAHKPGVDAACPVCNPLILVIADLECCAEQNEQDANDADAIDAAQARAVAGEQRRMIAILNQVARR